MKLNKTQILLFSLSCLLFATGYMPLSYAQTPASPSSQQLRDSVKQKVAQELAQIKQSVTKKAFVGNITAKTEATVTLTSPNNDSHVITVTTDTTIKLKNGKDGTPADLKVNDFILAMGDADAQNNMTAKRLLVIDQPDADKRDVIFGSVSAITSTSFTLSNTTYKVTSTTKFTNKSKFTDIKVGSKIVAIVNGTTATRLHIIGTSAPTATPTPTPKITVKPTAKPTPTLIP